MARRLALLVATYHYQDSGLRQLTAPSHDTEELAEVLRHPDISGFDVTILINEPNHVVGRAIGEFYRNRCSDDLTLLYFTGHGLKDDHGDLYLAMTDTNRDNLLYTAVSAQHIDRSMESSSCRQKVLILDCCYSGAFPAGRISKAGPEVHTLKRFRGKGRVVLTASDATQYSFQGNKKSGHSTRSVFTRFLVDGLATGKGDLDGDGDICLDELYSYVHDRVVAEMPQQRPKKQEDVEGRIVVARNIHWVLPTDVRHAMESSVAMDRLGALDGLAHLHRIGNSYVRAVVLHQVRRLIDDDSNVVSATAVELEKTLNSDGLGWVAEEQDAREVRVSHRRCQTVSAGRSLARPLSRLLSLRPTFVVAVILAIIVVVVLAVNITDSTTSWRVAATILVGDGPTGVAVAPDGRYVYVANSNSDDVSVIDTGRGVVTTTISVGNSPRKVLVTLDGGHVYVANSNSDDVSVIDTGRGVVTTTIAVGDGPREMVLAPDSRHGYVTNYGSNDVSVIDIDRGVVAATISVGDGPRGAGVASDGGYVYVANTDSDDVSVIEISGG